MRRAKSLLAALGVIVAAGVVPLATATSASADQIDCVTFLKHRGYRVGLKVRAACDNPGFTHAVPNPACVVPLVQLGVKPDHATIACNMVRG